MGPTPLPKGDPAQNPSSTVPVACPVAWLIGASTDGARPSGVISLQLFSPASAMAAMSAALSLSLMKDSGTGKSSPRWRRSAPGPELQSSS